MITVTVWSDIHCPWATVVTHRLRVARDAEFPDYERSKSLPIHGSPQVFWPDGTTTHNPGLDDHEWVRGIPRLRSDDPAAPADLLRAALHTLGR